MLQIQTAEIVFVNSFAFSRWRNDRPNFAMMHPNNVTASQELLVFACESSVEIDLPASRLSYWGVDLSLHNRLIMLHLLLLIRLLQLRAESL